jgi:predicted DNA-binding transcriptional regulator YafY
MEDQVRITNYLVLSPREILALYLAQGALLPLANTPFHSDLHGLFRKIDDKLGQSSRDHLNEIRDGFKFDPGPLWGLGMNPDVIEALRSATSERHILRGVYASASSNTTRERHIGPHYLYFAKGSLYLVGEDMENKTVKVFSAPRFKSAEMTDEPYTGAITSPSDYFQDSFGVFNDNSPPVDVKIQFSRHIAAYVRERKWHSSQRINERPDGGIEMQLHCQVNLELVRWILGFGANARVTEPAALMESIKKESENVQEMYGK